MPIKTFNFDGKIYKFESYAELARKLPKLSHGERYTTADAERLYRTRNQMREIVKSDTTINYVDISKSIKPQLLNLGLRYNNNIVKKLGTLTQKGRELNRDMIFKGIPEIVSVSGLGRNRTPLNISELGSILNGLFTVEMKIQVSADIILRKITFNSTFDPENANNFILERTTRINNYMIRIGAGAQLLEQTTFYTASVAEKNKNMELYNDGNDYFIRDVKPLSIKGLFNAKLFEYENKEKKNCLINFLENHFKKGLKKEIKKMSDTPTFEDLKNFCINNKINTILFDIAGKCIFDNKITTDKTSIKAVIHNNHIYPIEKNNKITKLIKNIYKLEKHNKNNVFIENKVDFELKIVSFIENGIMPIVVSENHFVVDDKHYILNEQMTQIKKGFSIFGCKEINARTNQHNFIDNILALTENDFVNSYFPYEYRDKGLGYSNDNIDISSANLNDVFAIDANKAYSSALASLVYLPEIDIRYNEHKIYNGETIEEDKLYVVKTSSPSVFFPDNYAFIWGWYILRIQEIEKIRNDKLDYTITEYITCNKKPNYYRYHIEKLYKSDDKEFIDFVKLAMNIHMGKFQKFIGERNEFIKKVDYSVMTKEHLNKMKALDSDMDKIFSEDIDDVYSFVYSTKKEIKIRTSNNLPLSYAVIQKARLNIINKLIELNYNSEDVLLLKTDAIYLLNKDKKYSCKTNNELYGFKKVIPKIEDFKQYTHVENSEISFNTPTIHNKIKYSSNALAGGGKTHYILNSLIPTLNNYVVLSSFHLPLVEYRKNKINSNVISHYMYNNKNIEEENIIIDEFGLMSKTEWNFILDQLYKNNKNIFLFGDNKQLPPVNGFSVSNFFLSSHSESYTEEWKNYRNNFNANEYYEMINKNNDIMYAKELIKKYCSNTDNDALNIAYRNKNRNQINNDFMTKNNYVMNENEISVGVKLINKTNNLNVDGLTIYNKHQFKVVESKDGECVLEDTEGIKINVSNKIIIDNMELAFCLTLYSIQGQTIPKINFCSDDVDMINKIPNALYTLISRTK